MLNIASSVADGDLLHGIFAGEDGWAPLRLIIGKAEKITITGTTYDTRKGDFNKIYLTTSGSATTITIQPESAVPIPELAVIAWLQMGAGQITFAAGAGVTIRTPETLKSAKQYAGGSLLYLGSDEWVLTGNLEAA